MQQTVLQFYLESTGDTVAARFEERLRIVVDHGTHQGGGKYTVEWLTTDATGAERWIDPRLIEHRQTKGYVQWALGCALSHLINGSTHQHKTFGGGVLRMKIIAGVADDHFEPLWVQRQS